MGGRALQGVLQLWVLGSPLLPERLPTSLAFLSCMVLVSAAGPLPRVDVDVVGALEPVISPSPSSSLLLMILVYPGLSARP